MKAALHIQLTKDPHQIQFQTDAQKVLSRFSDVTIFGLDNHSSSDMFRHAEEVLKRASTLLVLIESKSTDANPGKIIRLINMMIREKPAHMRLVVMGKHPLVEKMAQSLRKQYKKPDLHELQNLAVELFT